MKNVFLYGTLRHLPLLEVVLGTQRQRCGTPRLPTTSPSTPAKRVFRSSWRGMGAVAKGILVAMDDTQVARVDFYEGPYGYALQPASVMTE